jgi:hypothetical protein
MKYDETGFWMTEDDEHQPDGNILWALFYCLLIEAAVGALIWVTWLLLR